MENDPSGSSSITSCGGEADPPPRVSFKHLPGWAVTFPYAMGSADGAVAHCKGTTYCLLGLL